MYSPRLRKAHSSAAQGSGSVEQRQEGKLAPANISTHENRGNEDAEVCEATAVASTSSGVVKKALKVEGDQQQARDNERGEYRGHPRIPDRVPAADPHTAPSAGSNSKQPSTQVQQRFRRGWNRNMKMPELKAKRKNAIRGRWGTLHIGNEKPTRWAVRRVAGEPV